MAKRSSNTTTSADVDLMASMAMLGLATAEQLEELAKATMDTCAIVARIAVANRLIRHEDLDDVVQTATIKAFTWLPRWSLQRASWKTYVSVITRSVVADQGRNYQKYNNIVDAWTEYCNCSGSVGDETQEE